MTKEQLEKIMSKSGAGGSGVGLANINRRLRMIYGTRLSIQSQPGVGTKITVILPKGNVLMKAIIVDDVFVTACSLLYRHLCAFRKYRERFNALFPEG